MPSAVCPSCKGFGLTPKRNRFGFGVPCPVCHGTGRKPKNKPPAPTEEAPTDGPT